MKQLSILLLLNLAIPKLFAQLTTDSSYRPIIQSKMYPNNDGTIIHIDEAHNNLHTKDGHYQPFARILVADGYQIKANHRKFGKQQLEEIKLLVIVNARPDGADSFQTLPTQSAFEKEEIQAIETWVRTGGSLFLVADHMPFAGASSKLAETFGFEVYNSFVMNSPSNGVIYFTRLEGTLIDNSITKGRNGFEEVDKVMTFTGNGFMIPGHAIPILQLTNSQTVYLTKNAWDFMDVSDKFSAEGLCQGAVLTYGEGKVAFFGEAAMFTARRLGKKRIGMNHKKAEQNYLLLLNIIHWLDGKLE